MVSSSVALVSTVVAGKLLVVVKTLGKEVTMVVSSPSGFVDNTVLGFVSSFVVVSTGFTLVSAVVAVDTLVVVVTTLGREVTTLVSVLVVVAGTDLMVLRLAVSKTALGPVVSTFSGFVGNTVLDSLSSSVVVSTGSAVVPAVDVVGKLVVVVKTLGLEVTTVVSGIVVVAGTDVMILRVSLVDAVLGSIVSTFGGFVGNTV